MQKRGCLRPSMRASMLYKMTLFFRWWKRNSKEWASSGEPAKNKPKTVLSETGFWFSQNKLNRWPRERYNGHRGIVELLSSFRVTSQKKLTRFAKKKVAFSLWQCTGSHFRRYCTQFSRVIPRNVASSKVFKFFGLCFARKFEKITGRTQIGL